MIRVKRLHGPQKPNDGKRFLVDRLWLGAKLTGQVAHHGS